MQIDNGFFFDGVLRAKDYIEQSYRHPNCSSLIKHIYSRIVSPFTTLIELISTIVTQTLRGLSLILCSIIACDSLSLLHGIKDLYSVVAQVVALPFVAAISIINPQWAIDTCNWLLKSGASRPTEQVLRKNALTAAIAGLFIHIVAVPTSIVRNVTMTINHAITLHFSKAFWCALLIIKEIIVNLSLAIGSIVSEDLRKRAFFTFKQTYVMNPRDEFLQIKNAHT